MAYTGSRRSGATPTAQKKHIRFAEPKKEKRVVTTNVIFKNSRDRIQKHKKPILGRTILTSRRQHSPSPAPKGRSLASDSNAILNDYRGKVTTTAQRDLNHAYKYLVKRLEQTTLQLNSLSARITQATESGQSISTPLANETVKVRFRDPKGNITHGQIPIGKTVSVFENKLKEKQAELEGLWEEWTQVRQEIAEAGARILHEPKFPTRFGLDATVTVSYQVSQDPVDREIQKIRNEIRLEGERMRGEVDLEAEERVEEAKATKKKWLAMMQNHLI